MGLNLQSGGVVQPVANSPSDSARRYAESQFPDNIERQTQLAAALTLLEKTDGAHIARLIEDTNIKMGVDGLMPGMAGQYYQPFSGGNIAESFKALVKREPLPHEIRVGRNQFANPRSLAALIAHEGAHYKLTKEPEKNIPIRVGAGLMAAIGMIASLPTLGMIDMGGHVHSPGMGALASAMQGSVLVTGATHENYAYRVGDAVEMELGGRPGGYVYDEDGNPRSWLDGGWRISTSSMEAVTEAITGDDEAEPKGIATAVLPFAGIGLGLAARKLLMARGVSGGWATAMVYGPGAVALVAQVLLNRMPGGVFARVEERLAQEESPGSS